MGAARHMDHVACSIGRDAGSPVFGQWGSTDLSPDLPSPHRLHRDHRRLGATPDRHRAGCQCGDLLLCTLRPARQGAMDVLERCGFLPGGAVWYRAERVGQMRLFAGSGGDHCERPAGDPRDRRAGDFVGANDRVHKPIAAVLRPNAARLRLVDRRRLDDPVGSIGVKTLGRRRCTRCGSSRHSWRRGAPVGPCGRDRLNYRRFASA